MGVNSFAGLPRIIPFSLLFLIIFFNPAQDRLQLAVQLVTGTAKKNTSGNNI
jgi:hypothetical protein